MARIRWRVDHLSEEETHALLQILRTIDGNCRRMTNSVLLRGILRGRTDSESKLEKLEEMTPTMAMVLAKHGRLEFVPPELQTEQVIITAFQHEQDRSTRLANDELYTPTVIEAILTNGGKLSTIPHSKRTLEACNMAIRHARKGCLLATVRAIPAKFLAPKMIIKLVTMEGQLWSFLRATRPSDLPVDDIEMLALQHGLTDAPSIREWSVEKVILLFKNHRKKKMLWRLGKALDDIPNSILDQFVAELGDPK